MRNLLLEKDLALLLELSEGEQAVATCCGVLDQPCLYVATNQANIVCLATGNESPQASAEAVVDACTIPI